MVIRVASASRSPADDGLPAMSPAAAWSRALGDAARGRRLQRGQRRRAGIAIGLGARFERAPGLPSATAAIACASSPGTPCRSDRTRATSAAESRPNLSCEHRDRIVGSSISGRDVTRMNTDAGGGSSRLFSSAFSASSVRRSASSTITTRQRPSNGL